MEEDNKASVATSSRVSSAPPPPSSSNPSKQPPAPAAAAPSHPRQRFSVELKPGDTTIVSWKRLLKESSKQSGKNPNSSGVDPALEPHGGPAASVQLAEGELQDGLPPSNRFSAVIEKIERLYMGKQSSDEEELDDVPDDDQYDTEDSFIDDAELDEYFQVDKLSTKHNGFFVNRGRLERIESSPSPNLAPKKRRRKDSTRFHSESDREQVNHEPVNTGNMRIKAAARSAPLVGKKLSSPAKMQPAFVEHYEEAKNFKNKLNASSGTHRKRPADIVISLENPSSMKAQKVVASLPYDSTDSDKHKAGIIPPRDHAYKSRSTNESVDAAHQASRDRSAGSLIESQSKKLLNGENGALAEASTKMRRKERYGIEGYPDMSSAGCAYPVHAVQPSAKQVKEGSTIRPKGSTLERAIRDLEKIVAVCRPPKLDIQEVDTSSQGVKRRLPQEVKQKLAKVARLSANQGKISEDDLIDRLMGIVGHLVQRKTLKRNMREMVELGLSAKQHKADRLQQIKQEVNEMIRTRVALLKSKVAEQQDGSADDFQESHNNEERGALKRYGMDIALEDKICDLYDLYVEGMDEDKGPQSRKLYVELAELWPNGYMDNYGIKDAIFRSKERKRARIYRHKVRDEERIKRKKLASAVKVEEVSLGTQLQSGQERPAMDSTVQVFVPSDKVISSQTVASSGRTTEAAPPSVDSGHHHVSKHHDKARGTSSTSTIPDSGSKAVVADVKKKIKRKPEFDAGDIHSHPPRLPSPHGKERHSSNKQSENTNVSHQLKPNLQSQGAPISDQPS